ncbi:MAG: regulatory protein GemA [Magnetococcales bacterium]|nr:regulatory protein GemA [Magnetococcales bacterium]
MPTHAQLAMIHIAKKSLAMNDDHYRAALERFGVQSSKDLTDRQADELIDLFVGWGWQPVHRPARQARRAGKVPPGDKSRYLNKIIKLLDVLGRLGDGEALLAYADGIAHEMFFRDQPNVVLPVEHCTIPQLLKIIQALEIHVRRLRGRETSASRKCRPCF